LLLQQWQLSTSNLILLAIVPVVSVLLLRMSGRNSGLKLPPGPTRLPIVGNLHQIGSLPHRSLQALARRHGPVMMLKLGMVPTVVLSSPEAAREAMKTHDADCSSRSDSPGPRLLSYGYRDVAFSPYSEYVREMRKLFISEMLCMRLDTFSGGNDSSSITLHWAMAELMLNPRVLKKVQDEIRAVVGKKERVQHDDMRKLKYLRMVVKETLRLHPPATLLIPRETIRHINVGGYDIPAKTKVIVNAWAIGRDPKIWKDPEEFCPDRFEETDIDFNGAHFELIPFGSGCRICPGLAMAVLNMEFILANMLFCFNWELPEGMRKEDIDMKEAGGLLYHKKTPLLLLAIRQYTTD
ncbi:hypothetical protein ABZP36_018898, partial [Zizania latifolia]